MKNYLLLYLLLITFSVKSQDFVDIPDANFEQALIDLEIDSDGVINQSLLRSDAESVTELRVSFPLLSDGSPNPTADPRVTITEKIQDLTGIEAFTSLSVLYCENNQLSELNLTNNSALTILECQFNQLTGLDVSQNSFLEILGFSENNISELDVSQNLELTAFFGVNNNLSSVNLDANTKLIVYGLSNNPLTYVSLKNGNNVNVVYFEAFNTPSLDCINSDAIVPASMTGSGKTFSEDCSTSLAGRWNIAPEAGSLKVGPELGSGLWFSISDEQVLERSCYYNDIYEFGEDGTFQNSLGDETFLEPFQNGTEFEAFCATPVAPHDGSAIANYVYNQLSGTITLNGTGAYLGLPKVFNGGELVNPIDAPNSITYNVSFEDNGNLMTLMIESSPGVYWTFKLVKEAVFIPDTNFEQALIDLEIDTDGEINKRISRSDAEAATELLVNFPILPNGNPNPFADSRLTITEKITDLSGIEAFVNITNLGAGYNELTSIDISNNTNLTELFVNDNLLTGIDVSNNTLLTRLGVMRNPFTATTVDTSNNILLEELYLHETGLSTIDISANTNLWRLYANNNNLTGLDVSNNTNLTWLRCSYNNITALDISSNQLLNRLDAEYNAGLLITTDAVIGNATLNSLNLSGTGLSNYNLYAGLFSNLEWLLLNDNLLDRFNANNALNVKNLFLNNNMIDKLDLSANVALLQLYATNNVLTELDLRNGNNVNITNVDVTNNLLTCISVDNPDDTSIMYSSWLIDSGVTLSLDCRAEPEVVLIPDSNFELALSAFDSNDMNGNILLSDALAIINLDISGSSISELTGIEAFENLITLDVSNNNLNSLILVTEAYNGPTNLVDLNVSGNLLSELFVPDGRDLITLDISDNLISTINIEALDNLEDLNIASNLFETIDVSGLNNLTIFNASDNPYLLCIGVSDPNNILGGWIKDDHSVYSNNPDCIAPTVIAQDETIPLDDRGEVTVDAILFDAGSYDNVTANENLIFELSKYDFDCSNIGENSIEFMVIDEAGNMASQFVNLTIVDTTPPEVTAENSFTGDLNGNSIFTLTPEDVLKSSSDNCGAVDLSVSPSVFTSPGTYTVTLTATDGSGNTAEDFIDISIEDSAASEVLKFRRNLEVTVYPVPFTSVINLSFSDVTDMSTVSVVLTDINGMGTGIQFYQVNGNYIYSDDTSTLVGAYIISVTVAGQTRSAQIVSD